MNVRKGYRRLAVATVGSWAVTWALVGAYATWSQGTWSRLFIEASRQDRAAEMAYANERAQHSAELLASAFGLGLLAVPLAIFFALGWWVIVGFSPNK